MQSEIRVRSGNFKLYLSLGLCATVVVIFLAVWFSFEFSIILLGIGGVMVIAGGVGIYGRVLAIRYNRALSQIEIARQHQQLRIITAEADKAELAAGIFTFPRTERALLLPGNNMQFIEAVAGGASDAGATLALSAGSIDLLPLLDQAQRVLVKGASDAGKTTLIQHVAARAGGNVTIVDPHYEPGVWLEGARIIGAGQDYAKIGAYLDYLATEMHARYKRRAVGDTAVLIEGIPPAIDETELKPLLEESLAELHDLEKQKAGEEDQIRRLAACISRRARTRKRAYSLDEARQLIQQLRLSKDPFRCPQGRPTVHHVREEEIENYFAANLS